MCELKKVTDSPYFALALAAMKPIGPKSIIVVMLALVLVLFGCSKTPTAAKIVGEWRIRLPPMPGTTVTFHPNGSFVYSSTFFDPANPEVLRGKWEIHGKLIEGTVIEQKGHLNSFYHFRITPAGDLMLFEQKLVGDKVGEFDQSKGLFFEGPFFAKP